jgi:tetratricopeptide (TPR) repeat protein
MRSRLIGAREQSTAETGSPRVRWTVIWSLAATIALAAAGCVTAPKLADPQTPPPSTRDDLKALGTDQAPSSNPRTDFQEKATFRQQFQVHIDFGRVFEAEGNLDAAIKEYQDALTVTENKRRGPFRPADAALAHRRIGSAMDRQGRFPQAETHYKTALKLNPKDPKTWNDAGYSYYLQGRWDDAERALKTAVRLAPDDERIRTNLGLTLAAAGRTAEALPLLSQSNGEAIGHANLGYLLAATGQLDLARQQYEAALALRPDLTVAHRALAQIDQKQALSQSPGMHPTSPAQSVRSTAHPIDPGVNQASTATIKVPPPLPSRILPEARAPSKVDRQASRPTANIPDLVTLPPCRLLRSEDAQNLAGIAASPPSLPESAPSAAGRARTPPAQVATVGV